MPKHLAKVQKQIAKKKGVAASSLHENSRDAKRLRRAGARSEKLEKLAAARAKAYQPYQDQILSDGPPRNCRTDWRGGHASDRRDVLKAPNAIDMPLTATLNSYLSRNAGELAAIQSERRPGRPTSSREDMLKQAIDAEDKEYASGFWIPDTSDAATVDRLAAWNGEWASLNTLKFVRIAKDGRKHSSSFPPNGNS
ncbi:MAG: hypothetical protein Q9202_003516 [Teloschistes flavicans]